MNWRTSLAIGLIALLPSMGCNDSTEEHKPRTKLSEVDAHELAKSDEAIFGTVVEETYIGAGLKKVGRLTEEGVFYKTVSNETVTEGTSKYLIKIIREDTGRPMVVEVVDNARSKEALDQLIGPGDRVGITRGNVFSKRYAGGDAFLQSTNQTYIVDDTQTAVKYADWMWLDKPVSPTTLPEKS